MKQRLIYVLILKLHICWTFAQEGNSNKNLETTPFTYQDIPNSPQLLGVECSIKEATIRWKPMGDNRSPILYYIIQYNTSFTPEEWKDFGQAPYFDTTYNGPLQPWANYTFRVAAVNKIGQSLPSLHSYVCTTPPEVPRKNPANVRAQGTRPDNLVITWTPMAQIDHGGPGFKYRIAWKRAIDRLDYKVVDIHNYKQDTLIIPNQPTYKEYKIVVSATNELGHANAAPQVVTGYSGENEPEEPPTNFTLIAILGPTTALLSWEHIPTKSVRGHFKGYKIKTWSETSPTAKEIQVHADVSKALLSNFDPYTTNYAQIYVFNKKYNGPPSSTISFETPEGIPEGMQHLIAYPLGDTGFLLKWDKPDKTNGILTGYNIYWSKIDSFLNDDEINARNPQITDPNVNTAKLGGLEVGFNYRIYISATTKAGESKRYFIERNTKQQNNYIPSKPSFEWNLEKSGSYIRIRIHWLPAEDGKGGTHFFVKYRKHGESSWEQSLHEKIEDWIIISGLEGSTVYEFIVTAVDGPDAQFYTDSEMQEIRTYDFEGPVIMVREPTSGKQSVRPNEKQSVKPSEKQLVKPSEKQSVKPTNESLEKPINENLETEETRNLTNSELQRLVLLKQLQELRLKKEKLPNVKNTNL